MTRGLHPSSRLPGAHQVGLRCSVLGQPHAEAIGDGTEGHGCAGQDDIPEGLENAGRNRNARDSGG